MTAAAVPSIAEIAASIAELDRLDDLDRAVAARRLARSVPKLLADIADAAVWSATREVSQRTAAERMGVGLSQIERAITRHRALHQL